MIEVTKSRAIALGYFDGVHLGHRALMQKAVERAKQIGGTSAVFTFDVHPDSVVMGRQVPLLTANAYRREEIKQLGGVDEVIFGHFDERMQHMDWRDFIHKLLIGQFHAGWIISGRNNRFGYKGQGNAEGMAVECEKAGIGYDCIEDVKVDGIVVSSTYIRQLIAQGDMEGAAKFLGHPYTVTGIVEHGRRVGTSVLKVPTVNLRLPSEMALPPYGVYATRVLVDGKSVGAVSTYTFENVVDNHTIHATFARKHTPTPSTPTVEIPDDDALGLNTTDHFAYIVGYGNGEVRPQNNITRAEVATIFFRLLTDDVRDENLTKTNRYSDVAATSWYNTAVSTLSSMGIITGYPDGTFRPNAAITRAEFAAIAARFDNDGDKTAAKFSDIATHWAKDEISIAYNNGWITGYPDGTFGPQRDITRAETMTLVNRVLNRQPETEDDLLPNMTVWTDNANPKAWYYLAVQEATNSHYYEFKTNSQYEKWTELRETRDWKALEQ